MRLYLDNWRRQQEPKPSLNIESRSRTSTRAQQDILSTCIQTEARPQISYSYKFNMLKRIWRTEPSIGRKPPVNVDPAIKEISRMNRQLRQQLTASQPCLEISHTLLLLLPTHIISFSIISNRLCIHSCQFCFSFLSSFFSLSAILEYHFLRLKF